MHFDNKDDLQIFLQNCFNNLLNCHSKRTISINEEILDSGHLLIILTSTINEHFKSNKKTKIKKCICQIEDFGANNYNYRKKEKNETSIDESVDIMIINKKMFNASSVYKNKIEKYTENSDPDMQNTIIHIIICNLKEIFNMEDACKNKCSFSLDNWTLLDQSDPQEKLYIGYILVLFLMNQSMISKHEKKEILRSVNANLQIYYYMKHKQKLTPWDKWTESEIKQTNETTFVQYHPINEEIIKIKIMNQEKMLILNSESKENEQKFVLAINQVILSRCRENDFTVLAFELDDFHDHRNFLIDDNFSDECFSFTSFADYSMISNIDYLNVIDSLRQYEEKLNEGKKIEHFFL